ncbi:hypothetical protein B0H17DRAFT_1142491 [Mycena rosella]|uniref:Uncharacterized protein n=1 Tax=Mycena rosella TaxID=1033263 RepID=A0AAD7G5H2_MYCRO|nr:hypothetical protein B0H17DRAFT_1142491 [Mycena rosella]
MVGRAGKKGKGFQESEGRVIASRAWVSAARPGECVMVAAAAEGAEVGSLRRGVRARTSLCIPCPTKCLAGSYRTDLGAIGADEKWGVTLERGGSTAVPIVATPGADEADGGGRVASGAFAKGSASAATAAASAASAGSGATGSSVGLGRRACCGGGGVGRLTGLQKWKASSSARRSPSATNASSWRESRDSACSESWRRGYLGSCRLYEEFTVVHRNGSAHYRDVPSHIKFVLSFQKFDPEWDPLRPGLKPGSRVGQNLAAVATQAEIMVKSQHQMVIFMRIRHFSFLPRSRERRRHVAPRQGPEAAPAAFESIVGLRRVGNSVVPLLMNSFLSKLPEGTNLTRACSVPLLAYFSSTILTCKRIPGGAPGLDLRNADKSSSREYWCLFKQSFVSLIGVNRCLIHFGAIYQYYMENDGLNRGAIKPKAHAETTGFKPGGRLDSVLGPPSDARALLGIEFGALLSPPLV